MIYYPKMSQHVEIVSEPSALYFWAEGSDKRPSSQHLRPNLQPIYQVRRIYRDPYTIITTETLSKLAKALGVPSSALIEDVEKPGEE